MARMFMVRPTTRVWNHRPRSPPTLIASNWLSRSGIRLLKSTDVSPIITPALWLTTLWVASKIPMTMFHVLLTMRMANADLKIQRKNMELSKSCILFFSVIIWISSMHMTQARMAAAMGSTTVSDRFCSILKMPLFHACGVAPTSAAISPTLAFTLSNSPDRLPVMPSIRIPFIHSSMISLITGKHLLSRALPVRPGERGGD